MPSTLTGVAASATQSTSPTATVPADGDSLAASGVQTPIQTILHHIAKLWAGAFAALGSNPALQATGSATRAGLNLVPQAAPSTPSDGDVWVETTSNQVKVRVNGATQILSTAQAIAGALSFDMWQNAGATTTLSLTASAWTTLTLFLAGLNSALGGVSVNAATGVITVPVAGTYMISISLAVGPPSNATSFAQGIRVLKNGATPLTGPTGQGHSISSSIAAASGALSSSYPVTLAANDTVALQHRSENSGTHTYYGATISVARIGA